MRRVKVVLIQRAFLGHYCPLLLQKRTLIGLCHTSSFGAPGPAFSPVPTSCSSSGVLALPSLTIALPRSQTAVGKYTRN